jgi:DNA primase
MRSLPSDDARDQIRLRLNLLDVVQQHVRLRKAGREHTGLCPFHQEDTPSFSVNEQKQSWYCFGCQRGGDIFNFVEQIEKTDFPGALRILAEMAGVELPERGAGGQERSQLRRRLVELNGLACQYYEFVLHELPAGEPGRQLLARREVDAEVARRFGLGYAPGGDNFAAFVRKRGHSMKDAIEGGLVRRSGQDFFQQRLVVPIRDERGQPVAFTGRTLLAEEPRKYVNTPETAAYVKGRVLFALDLARAEIEKRKHAVLMEGQFDVIVAHQFGVGNAIASSGTALTADQLTLLRRFTDEVVLVFDNDRAGRSAAVNAIEVAEEQAVRVRVARIEGEAKDPDEFLRGGGSWEELLREARPGRERMILDCIQDLNPQRPGDREIGIRKIRAVLGPIKDVATKDTYAQFAGRQFDIEPSLLLAYEPPAASSRRAGPAPDGQAAPRSAAGLPALAQGKKLSKGVAYLLQVLAVRPEALARVLGILDLSDLDEDDRAAYERMVTILERGGVDALGSELGEFPVEEQNLVRKAWAAPPPGIQDQVIDDVLGRIRRESLYRRHRAMRRSLDEAERRQDRAQVAVLEAQLRELSERI